MYQKEAPNLIAELGVNWDSIETAKKMIAAVSKAGANFVKFQLYNEQIIKDLPPDLHTRLASIQLTESHVKELKKEATKYNLSFLLTPMYDKAIPIAGKYCDDFIKIRFPDHENMNRINQALKTGKKVFVSVPNIPLEPFLMYHLGIRWLFCLPSYPPKVEEFNLDVASACHGFSSHYPHTVCDMAYILNRSFQECFVEKHIILNRDWKSPKEKPLDADASITVEELKAFKEWIGIAEKIQRFKM